MQRTPAGCKPPYTRLPPWSTCLVGVRLLAAWRSPIYLLAASCWLVVHSARRRQWWSQANGGARDGGHEAKPDEDPDRCHDLVAATRSDGEWGQELHGAIPMVEFLQTSDPPYALGMAGHEPWATIPMLWTFDMSGVKFEGGLCKNV